MLILVKLILETCVVLHSQCLFYALSWYLIFSLMLSQLNLLTLALLPFD